MREEERYGESDAGGQKRRYKVMKEINKAKQKKEPLTPIMDMLGHTYLQYKRSRSRMTWPP